MPSRKEFFKDLHFRGIRAVNDLAGKGEKRLVEHEVPGDSFDLPATELSPSLLAIEVEIRGIDRQEGSNKELRRKIYRELAQSRPPAEMG
jgi:hypothetical protein